MKQHHQSGGGAISVLLWIIVGWILLTFAVLGGAQTVIIGTTGTVTHRYVVPRLANVLDTSDGNMYRIWVNDIHDYEEEPCVQSMIWRGTHFEEECECGHDECAEGDDGCNCQQCTDHDDSMGCVTRAESEPDLPMP